MKNVRKKGDIRKEKGSGVSRTREKKEERDVCKVIRKENKKIE